MLVCLSFYNLISNTMKNKQKELLELVGKAYTTIRKGDKDISILDTDVITNAGTQNAILDIQRNLDVDFEQSYEVMAEACSILAEKTLESTGIPNGSDRDCLTSDDCDFFADADSRANVYTSVQLSYLTVSNESEISNLMKDEATTSIAQACSIWYSQKVAEACEALRTYILSQ